LDDELRFHLEMAEDRHRARGLPPEAARRAARAEFGGVAAISEAYAEQQTLPAFEHVLQDARYAVRALARTPAFTAAALLTIALGIGANVAIFSLVYGVLLRPLPYAAPDRMVIVGDRARSAAASDVVPNIGYTTIEDLRERNRTLESLAAMRAWGPTLVTADDAEQLRGLRVSWNFFEILRVAPGLGRSFAAADDRPDSWRVLILSDGLWRRRFGADPNVVGRRIRMNDREFEIIGVMPRDFDPLAAAPVGQRAEIWAPLGYDISLADACRSCRHLKALGRLKPAASVDEAATDLSAIRAQLARDHPGDYPEGDIAVARLADVLGAPVRPALLVLLGAVALVLLIACANVASLLLARGVARSRELALRAALGAGRRRLIAQLLAESTILSCAGGALGTALAALLIRSLEQLVPVAVPRLSSVSINFPVLAFAIALSLATGLLFGLAPAMRVSLIDLNDAFRADTRTASPSNRARQALVVADVAFAVILLAGAGLMLRTVGALVHAESGFDPSGVLTMQFSLGGRAYATPAAVVQFQDRLLQGLRQLPFIESAALAGQIPMGGDFDRRGFHIEGRIGNPADSPEVERYSVTPDYLRVMRIPVLRGRAISAEDTASSLPVLLVSDTTARTLFAGEDPLGERVRIGANEGSWRTIVGIVGDVHHDELASPPKAQMYLPQAQYPDSSLVLVLRTSNGRPESLAADVRRILHELDPGVPIYQVAPLDALVAKSFEDRRFVMRVLAGFAGLALLLAGIGLYGLVAYVVAQRRREFGVRLALGARAGDVLRLVLRAAAASVGIGVLLGCFGAAFTTRSLQSMLFGVTAGDPWSFGFAIAAVAAVSVAAHVVPALRAIHVDPVIALRTE
jgi:putative ABC transport system permease protein